MKPVEIERALERCDRISPWRRDETLKRWRWSIESYIDGYIDKGRHEQERQLFEDEAEKLIAEQTFRAMLAWEPRPPTEAEKARRTEWLRIEAERATRTELRRQRAKLREGHETLKAIRRLLSHAAAPSPRRASARARTSPT